LFTYLFYFWKIQFVRVSEGTILARYTLKFYFLNVNKTS
jgi:hypothetical protein